MAPDNAEQSLGDVDNSSGSYLVQTAHDTNPCSAIEDENSPASKRLPLGPAGLEEGRIDDQRLDEPAENSQGTDENARSSNQSAQRSEDGHNSNAEDELPNNEPTSPRSFDYYSPTRSLVRAFPSSPPDCPKSPSDVSSSPSSRNSLAPWIMHSPIRSADPAIAQSSSQSPEVDQPCHHGTDAPLSEPIPTSDRDGSSSPLFTDTRNSLGEDLINNSSQYGPGNFQSTQSIAQQTKEAPSQELAPPSQEELQEGIAMSALSDGAVNNIDESHALPLPASRTLKRSLEASSVAEESPVKIRKTGTPQTQPQDTINPRTAIQPDTPIGAPNTISGHSLDAPGLDEFLNDPYSWWQSLTERLDRRRKVITELLPPDSKHKHAIIEQLQILDKACRKMDCDYLIAFQDFIISNTSSLASGQDPIIQNRLVHLRYLFPDLDGVDHTWFNNFPCIAPSTTKDIDPWYEKTSTVLGSVADTLRTLRSTCEEESRLPWLGEVEEKWPHSIVLQDQVLKALLRTQSNHLDDGFFDSAWKLYEHAREDRRLTLEVCPGSRQQTLLHIKKHELMDEINALKMEQAMLRNTVNKHSTGTQDHHAQIRTTWPSTEGTQSLMNEVRSTPHARHESGAAGEELQKPSDQSSGLEFHMRIAELSQRSDGKQLLQTQKAIESPVPTLSTTSQASENAGARTTTSLLEAPNQRTAQKNGTKQTQAQVSDPHEKYRSYVCGLLFEPWIFEPMAKVRRITMTVTQQQLSKRTRLRRNSSGQIDSGRLQTGDQYFRMRGVKGHPRSANGFIAGETHWPDSMLVKFNNTEININSSPGSRPGNGPDVTSRLVQGINKVSASFKRSNDTADIYHYALAIEVITIVDISSIRQSLKAKAIGSVEARLQKQFEDLEDEEIEMVLPSIEITIRDPFTSTLPVLPVRSSLCTHFQCFDLDAFLESRPKDLRHPQFFCPICGKNASPEHLRIDRWMEGVLQQLKAMDRTDVKIITVSPDLSWTVKEEPLNQQRVIPSTAQGVQPKTEKQSRIIEVIELD